MGGGRDAPGLYWRRLIQRWYNETVDGQHFQTAAIYELISANPGAFVAMIKDE